jgi:hypothetical protein
MKRIASTATALLVWAVCMFVFTATSLSPESGDYSPLRNSARSGFNPTGAFKTNFPKETFRGMNPCWHIMIALVREDDIFLFPGYLQRTDFHSGSVPYLPGIFRLVSFKQSPTI